MNKKRVFLFGAGAVLEWGAPSTWELTNMILKSGFCTTDNKTTITQFIFDKLLDAGYTAKEVNFETIISVVEELIVYYSPYKENVPSLISPFTDAKYGEALLNYSIEGGEKKHGYKLEIPKGTTFPFSKFSYHNESPEQFFFEHLLNDLLTNICARIINYAYHSEANESILFDGEASKSFVEWMKLHSNETPLRLYTLNYDRLFKKLLFNSGLEVFEGFSCDNLIDKSCEIPADLLQIVNNWDGHVHYNLHGSAFWNVLEDDENGLPNAEIIYNHYPHLPSNNTPASLQVEKGKTLMITNIITGYQKAQKGTIAPFKQMQSALDKDCLMADEIYVIGYSFGDEHINSSLRSALRYNTSTKIIIVDPGFTKGDLDLEVYIKIMSVSRTQTALPKQIEKNVIEYCNGRIIAYIMKFDEFRKKELNPFNKAAKRGTISITV